MTKDACSHPKPQAKASLAKRARARVVPAWVRRRCKVLLAAHQSGSRPASDIDLLVIHCTESPNPGASGVANYFAHPPNDQVGSTQYVVDDVGCYRCVSDLRICWGASSGGHGANERGIHYEICGYASWSRTEWLRHLNTIKRVAWKVARDARKYRIPATWLDPAELRAGQSGITSHNNISVAWVPGGHSDPGPNFPYDKFMWWVHRYHEGME